MNLYLVTIIDGENTYNYDIAADNMMLAEQEAVEEHLTLKRSLSEESDILVRPTTPDELALLPLDVA